MVTESCGLDVRRGLELDDPGAEPLGRRAGRLQPVEDVGLGVGGLGAAGDGHAQPLERARPVARAQAAAPRRPGPGSTPGSVASATSSALASATLRAIGPGWSSVGLRGMQPSSGMRP